MFRCDVCGQRHPWTQDVAGQTFTCRCGEPVTAPTEPENDLYDLAPVPVEPIQSPVPLTAADPLTSSSVLGYQRPMEPGVDERYSEANPMIVSTTKDMVVPITLILVGTIVQFAWAVHVSTVSGVSPGWAVSRTGFQFVADVAVMLAGVIIAAQALSVSFGPVPTAILKLGAISIGPAGLMAGMFWAIGDGGGALFFAWLFRFVIYAGLFWYFFELDAEELWNTVLIIYGIRTITMFVLGFLIH